MIYEICGDVKPIGLIGQRVTIVAEPTPRFDRLVTVRFVDKSAMAAYEDDCLYAYPHPRVVRLPPSCLRPAA